MVKSLIIRINGITNEVEQAHINNLVSGIGGLLTKYKIYHESIDADIEEV